MTNSRIASKSSGANAPHGARQSHRSEHSALLPGGGSVLVNPNRSCGGLSTRGIGRIGLTLPSAVWLDGRRAYERGRSDVDGDRAARAGDEDLLDLLRVVEKAPLAHMGDRE